MGGEKTFNRWRQLHSPSRKTDKNALILRQMVYMRFQRWQIAAFIFTLYLFNGSAIIVGIRFFQFDGDQVAAGFRRNHFRNRFGIMAAAQIDNQIFGR